MTNERMLAIYRDAQDNSFLLDTLDTMLFYEEHKFFHNASRENSNSQLQDGRKDVLDEWIRTLDVQPRHKGNDHKDWQEPLQYALAIQMARHGHQIDSRPVSEIFDGALKVLLHSCSASGIFPGFFTRESKLSVNFDEDYRIPWRSRDSYWHTSFELPYLLWKHAKERLEETSGQDRNQSPSGSPPDAIQERIKRGTQSPMSPSTDDQKPMPKFLSTKTVLGGQDFTDQKNVFEISDEWLVPCPEILHFDPKTSFNDVLEATTQRKMSVAELRRLVIDIPKRRDQTNGQNFVDQQPFTSQEFFERLRQWRTKKANMLVKKRIIGLSSNDEEAAAICPSMVPESEKPALMDFFRKHTNLDKHFLDDPSASNNSWKTEFQLSFYQLEKPEKVAQSKPEIALAKRIRRASMGFRFNGDFFDCYWTCHIINFGDWMGEKNGNHDREAGGSTQGVEKRLDDYLSTKFGSYHLAFPEIGSKKHAWHQRKVLELILFEEIIRKVMARTQEILEQIKGVLTATKPSGSQGNETMKDLPDKVKETILFSGIDGNAYFSISAQWEVIQQLLQVLDEDLSDTAKKIENWQDREKNRGTETPRWTKKDEKRYRPALRRMQLSNAESVQGLLQLQEKVQSLRTSLIRRRDYIRDDLSLRGAEHTRYFTYVTVVFLPLGFATGIFSMSATPAATMLARMSGTAAITFVLTAIALYFAVKRLEAVNELRAALTKFLTRAKRQLKEILPPALTKSLTRAKKELTRILPLLSIAKVLLRALRELIVSFFKKLRAISVKPLARMEGELKRLLPPLFIMNLLLMALGELLVSNAFNNQGPSSPSSGSSNGNTNGGNSSTSLAHEHPEDQQDGERRRLSDLESQTALSH